MPRPDKQINPGRLDGDASSMRSYTWTKHNTEPGSSERDEPPSEIEIAVDDIAVMNPSGSTEPISKYEARGTAAHIVYDTDGPVQPPKVRYEPHWTSERAIDGRTYRRSDSMTMVEQPL